MRLTETNATPRRLRRAVGRVVRVSRTWGIDPQAFVFQLRGLGVVRRERKTFRQQARTSRFGTDFPEGRPYLITTDRYSEAGSVAGHYFHQDLIVARDIFRRKPQRHVDVGSSLYGFVSHLASFREVEVVDIRPIPHDIPGIRFHRGDVTKPDELDVAPSDSVSCLHALEHFGLGRYGDTVDFDGWKVGLHALTHMTQPGGILYLSVPTSDHQRVEFNAHRVFSLPFLREQLAEDFELESLYLMGDTGDISGPHDPTDERLVERFRAHYGLSVWFLRRRPPQG